MNDLASNFERRHMGLGPDMHRARRGWDVPAPPRTVRPVLTARQLECLKWVGEGKSSNDIGAILDIAPSTVNEHMSHACRRLGVRTRVQAIVACFRNGWLR